MPKGKLLNKPLFYIYKITFSNGATYIGSHIQYKTNDSYICSSRYYKRYPELKIKEREILFYLPTLEQMNIMEITYPTSILRWTVLGTKGLKMSKEFGNKISKANKEAVICIETNEIIDKVSDLPHGAEILNGTRKTYNGKHYRRYFSNESV